MTLSTGHCFTTTRAVIGQLTRFCFERTQKVKHLHRAPFYFAVSYVRCRRALKIDCPCRVRNEARCTLSFTIRLCKASVGERQAKLTWTTRIVGVGSHHAAEHLWIIRSQLIRPNAYERAWDSVSSSDNFPSDARGRNLPYFSFAF